MKTSHFIPTIPADVPAISHRTYIKNYAQITRNTGKLLLFTGDQKIEHGDTDFHSNTIHSDAHTPEHLFRIAKQGYASAFATQLGLINQYGPEYPDIAYIAKLNSKTNLVPTTQHDPISTQLYTIEDVLASAHNAFLSVCGVGYTIYIGSTHE